MKTKLIYFSDQQILRIQEDAKKHEISFTEMVRRILDYYYEEKTKEKINGSKNDNRNQR